MYLFTLALYEIISVIDFYLLAIELAFSKTKSIQLRFHSLIQCHYTWRNYRLLVKFSTRTYV